MADEPIPAGTAQNTGTGEGEPAQAPPAAPAAPAAPEVLLGGDTTDSTAKVEGEGTQDQTDKKDGSPDTAPEKYEFVLPEGVEMDADLLAKFEPFAREKNLPQAEAQKLIDLYTEAKLADVKAQQVAWVKQVNDWAETVRKDPEIGGTNFDGSITAAQKFIAKYGTDELKKELHRTGLGSNPEIVRLLARAGRAMSEDKVHTSTGGAELDRTPERILYPSMKPTN